MTKDTDAREAGSNDLVRDPPSRCVREEVETLDMLKCRGYWRRLLGLRGAVWYYSTEAPRKTADRPHALSLLLGLISPLLAIVALFISLQSLKTSETSLKVGQRAYLAVQNGELWVSRVAGTPAEVGIYLRCEVHNLGNTPGSIKDQKMAYGDIS